MNERARLARAEWKSHRTLVCSAMAGLSFYTPLPYLLGPFIEPLEQDFGWARTKCPQASQSSRSFPWRAGC